MKKIYFISGLGADERVFVNIKIEGVESRFIHWVSPSKEDNITSYSQKLLPQIDRESPVILIGVSFGGIIAQEIARLIQVEKVIIISSVKSHQEFNWQLKLVSQLKMHQLFPASFLKWSNQLTADYYFGTQNKEESQLLHQIIEDTDTWFMEWAIHALMNWKNLEGSEKEILHIHGTKDRIFPKPTIKNAIFIEGGGHFMVYNRAEEISEIIKTFLAV